MMYEKFIVLIYIYFRPNKSKKIWGCRAKNLLTFVGTRISFNPTFKLIIDLPFKQKSLKILRLLFYMLVKFQNIVQFWQSFFLISLTRLFYSCCSLLETESTGCVQNENVVDMRTIQWCAWAQTRRLTALYLFEHHLVFLFYAQVRKCRMNNEMICHCRRYIQKYVQIRIAAFKSTMRFHTPKNLELSKRDFEGRVRESLMFRLSDYAFVDGLLLRSPIKNRSDTMLI